MREKKQPFFLFFIFSVCVCVDVTRQGLNHTKEKRRGQTKTKERGVWVLFFFFLFHAFLPGLTYIVAAPGVSIANDAATRAMGTSTDVKRSPL